MGPFVLREGLRPGSGPRLAAVAVLGRRALCLVGLVCACARSGPSGGPSPAEPGVRLAWTFEPARRGAASAAPLVTDAHVYLAVIHDAGRSTSGTVYCLDRASRRVAWQFDDGGHMLHTIAAPVRGNGRLYLGEGMHADFLCKLYCLDESTGRKRWDFPAGGHIERAACLADGKAYFAAGDDGVYCLDAVSGARRWHFQAPVHVDTTPAIRGGRLYGGGGISRLYRLPEAFCLDARTGQPIWRVPTHLPVWGSPVVEGGDAFFGLGNGRLTESVAPPERPAGALVCLDADTGEERWRARAADGVLVRPVVVDHFVYFAARDGFVRAVHRRTGALAWEQDLGSPIVAAPTLFHGRLYVAASAGPVCAFAADSGERLWSFDVAAQSRTSPRLLSAPLVVAGPQGGRQILFGAELRNAVNSAAVLYCLAD